MSKELVKHEAKSISLQTVDDVSRVSKLFYESGMFKDVASAAQAGVKIMAGAEIGIAPFQAMSGISIINGKPTIGAGIMASMLDRHPAYDSEVIKHDDKECSIAFYKNGKKRGVSTFTMKMAQDAGLTGKDVWKKYGPNMLYARAMSNGVRWYAPGLFTGPVYTHEELSDETHDIEHSVVPETSAEVVDQETGVDLDMDEFFRLIQDVDNAESLEELKAIWESNKGLQKNEGFKKAMAERKKALKTVAA